jgi:hypothetical protein
MMLMHRQLTGNDGHQLLLRHRWYPVLPPLPRYQRQAERGVED